MVVVSERMWSLSEFSFDESIAAAEVYLDRGDGLELIPRVDALAFARARGANLISEYPIEDFESEPDCIIAKVSVPLRWERLPVEPVVQDERLWFLGSCGQRDILLGNAHTFPGRISAWCPHEQTGYSVSLAEIEEMSTEARYFITGFLAGNEPGYPLDAVGEESDADMTAWYSALARFRRTGYWAGGWATCGSCGCVLLPDSAEDFCHEHLQRPRDPRRMSEPRGRGGHLPPRTGQRGTPRTS